MLNLSHVEYKQKNVSSQQLLSEIIINLTQNQDVSHAAGLPSNYSNFNMWSGGLKGKGMLSVTYTDDGC